MSRQVPSITSMAVSAEEERRRRTRQYLITMAIRSVCVLLMVFVRGPWLFVVAAGAIFLPWIAVVIANHVQQRKTKPVLRPEAPAIERPVETIGPEQWYVPDPDAVGPHQGQLHADSRAQQQAKFEQEPSRRSPFSRFRKRKGKAS